MNPREKTIEIVKKTERDILITKDEEYSSQKLFDSLTSDRRAIISIKGKKQQNLISILNQLVSINSSDTWVTREKLKRWAKKVIAFLGSSKVSIKIPNKETQ